MSKNKPFNDGIELLREVSQRKSSLTDEERKEVGEMVKRAQEHKPKPSPIHMIRKKLTEINVRNISINTTRNQVNSDNNNNNNNYDNDDVNMNSNDIKLTPAPKTNGKPAPIDSNTHTGSTNKWGKELFRNFSVNSIQNPLSSSNQTTTSKGDVDRRLEFLKNFEQSSKSGREMLSNFSKKIQNPLSSISVSSQQEQPSPSCRTMSSLELRRQSQVPSPTIVVLPPETASSETKKSKIPTQEISWWS